MTYKILIGVCLALLLAACASQDSKTENTRPSWVMSESPDYPRQRFLTGVGEGDTMADAKARARAEISNIFSVSIQASTSDYTAFKQRLEGQSVEGQSLEKQSTERQSNYQSIIRDIQSSTEQDLEGVKIAEVWQDSTQRYYALAVLPRQVTAMNLRSNIERLDEATQSIIDRVQNTSSLVKKIRLSAATIPLQQQRRVLNKQLQVISVTGQSISAPWSVEKLQLDYEALIARITVTAMATGLEENKLQTQLEDALANHGFSVLPSGAYLVKAHLESTPLPQQGQWFYEKGNLSISLVGDNQQSLGGFTWNFKVSSSDPTLTRLRVLEQANKFLQTELNTKLFEILEKKD